MHKKGFSFIEILVVVMIAGIFLSLSAFGFQNARDSSRDTKRLGDMQRLRSGLSRFKADCISYPTAAEFNAAKASGTLSGIPSKSTNCLSTNTYITDFPKDPEDPTVVYSYTLVDPNNYILCASLLDIPNPTQTTTGCASCGGRACNIKYTN